MKRIFNIALLPLVLAAAIGFLCSWPGGATGRERPKPAVAATAVPAPVRTPVPAPETVSAPENADEPEEPAGFSPDVTDYYAKVEAGRVRYVSQLNEPESNGWGKYSWKAGMECTTACISMALSYLGIDESPEALLDFSSRTYLCSCYGLDDEYPIAVSPVNTPVIPEGEEGALFRAMMESYLAAEENSVSPVVVYVSGNGHNHCLLVIGFEGEEYLALDPADSGVHRFSITEDGQVTTPEREYFYRYTAGGDADVQICSLGQWQMERESGSGD